MATKEAAGGWSRETEQKLLNAALARARRLYGGRPDVLRDLDAARRSTR